MTRLSAAIAAVVLVGVGTLSGCSGGDGSDYCNRVRDNAKNKTLENINARSKSATGQFLAEAKQLRADAPDELTDEYNAIVRAFEEPANANAQKVTGAIDTITTYDEDHCDVTYEGG